VCILRALVGQPLWVSSHADTGSSRNGSGGIDLRTLLITAAASAAAAYTCSKIWAPGTLASAAFTPVLVAIIKEALARPTQAVTRAVPVRGVVRSASPADEPPEPPPLDRVAQPGEVTYHSTRRSARRWRMAIITGLLGFVVAVLVLTLPELVTGRSASGGGRGTTLFGGQARERKQPTRTTTAPARTVTVPAPAKTTTTPTTTTTTPTTTTTTPTTTTTTPTSTAPTVTPPPRHP
jgi:hypothetical protein